MPTVYATNSQNCSLSRYLHGLDVLAVAETQAWYKTEKYSPKIKNLFRNLFREYHIFGRLVFTE